MTVLAPIGHFQSYEQGPFVLLIEVSSPPGHFSLKTDQLPYTFITKYDVAEIHLSVFVLFM